MAQDNNNQQQQQGGKQQQQQGGKPSAAGVSLNLGVTPADTMQPQTLSGLFTIGTVFTAGIFVLRWLAPVVAKYVMSVPDKAPFDASNPKNLAEAIKALPKENTKAYAITEAAKALSPEAKERLVAEITG
jgi:hypothetical protein